MARRRKADTDNPVKEAERTFGSEVAACHALGLPVRTWARWKAMKGIPQTKWAVKVSEATGIPVERFVPPEEK